MTPMTQSKKRRQLALMVFGGCILFLLIQTHADSNLIATVAGILGFNFVSSVYSHNTIMNEKVNEIDQKTEVIKHQTNSDLDRRMQAENDRVIAAVKVLLDERDAQHAEDTRTLSVSVPRLRGTVRGTLPRRKRPK